MTEEQTAKLVKRLEYHNFGQCDTAIIVGAVRSVLRESKPAPTSRCGRPYPCAYCDGIPQRYHEPESVEKGGAR
jgi:hypothetical protein